MFRRHLIFWAIFLTILLGAGWYKSFENRRDRQRQTAWWQNIERLQKEARTEYDHIVAWIKDSYSQPDARQQIEKRLQHAWSVNFGTNGKRVVAEWTHRQYGIRLRTEFEGNKLVGHGARSGQVLASNPQPPRIAISSRAESVRAFVTSVVGWLWLAFLPVAIVSSRWGLLVAEAMLAISLVCGAAWLVAPNYRITLRGIFSNDPLFFAAIMYLVSLVCLAFRLAAELARLNRPVRFRFGLRTLLVATGVVAMLLAMGPFGYFALCVLGIGSLLFLGICICWLVYERRSRFYPERKSRVIHKSQIC